MTPSEVQVWQAPTQGQEVGVPFERLDGSSVIGLAHGEGPRRLRSGLEVSAVDALRAWLNVPVRVLAAVVGISDRTLSRRRKEGSRLAVDESDRVLRLSRLCEMAASALAGSEAGAVWMRSPHRLLGGESPMERAVTNPGAQQVESLLASIEYTMPV